MRQSLNTRSIVRFVLIALIGLLMVRCATTPTARRGSKARKRSGSGIIKEKIDLWKLDAGPHLRGANIYQRRVYPELDGTEFMGSSYLGPPYTQKDFDRLAELGANYVNISHPGLFNEKPPYNLDKRIQASLDKLLTMVGKADMFAVISFRTGPGRSEFTFHLDDVGDWFDESYLNDQVWKEQEAQLDSWDPKEFYSEYADTLYDWNQLYPRISDAIRQVDADTPILIGGMSYSAVQWLPYLQPTGDPHTVYMVHQYEPVVYTHQEPPLKNTYPGVFDTDWDEDEDKFGRAWLENLLSTVDKFSKKHDVPLAVNEFGVMRWEPGAAKFMNDQMDLFEQRGMNYALWAWETSWAAYAEEVDAFNFRHGLDPDRHADVKANKLEDVIVKYWRRNTVRPSNTTFAEKNVN